MTPSVARRSHDLLSYTLIGLLAAASPITASAGDQAEVPHLDAEGRQAYTNFLASPVHRAFAIAPGGAWAWSSDEPSPHRAQEMAVEACADYTEQQCVAYAVDNEVVFDNAAWPRLWGPYTGTKAAETTSTGTKRWQRFPNLAFRSTEQEPLSIADWRGKVTVLHFWGTWCTYCLPELKEIQSLQEELSALPDVAFILLQVREPFAVASEWLRREGFTLPLYDSGSRSSDDNMLLRADGSTIRDRELARVFPTTYVLDKHGIVLFSRAGPAPDWNEYAPFIHDAAMYSGG